MCYRCGRPDVALVFAGAGNQRVVNGKKRRATHVRCENGHEWYSIHPEALTLAKAVDDAEAGRASDT